VVDDNKEITPAVQSGPVQPSQPPIDIPEGGEKVVGKMMASFMASSRNYPPFLDKIEGPQISEMIRTYDESDKREFRDQELKRRYSAGYVASGIGLVVFFTLTLVSQDIELYKEIIKLLLAFGFGMAGGYGIGKARGK